MPALIILNGYPGVGKLTVAKELVELLPSSKLFSNHLLIDVAAALYERDDPAYQPLRKALRAIVFKSLSDSFALARKEEKQLPYLVFTEQQSSSPSGTAVMTEYLDFAKAINVPILSVILVCSEYENHSRLHDDERLGSKLKAGSVLYKMRENEDIRRFGGDAALEMVLDTSNLSAQEAAHIIYGRVHFANEWSTAPKAPASGSA